MSIKTAIRAFFLELGRSAQEHEMVQAMNAMDASLTQENFMVDFRPGRFAGQQPMMDIGQFANPVDGDMPDNTKAQKGSVPVYVKPIEVFHELERRPQLGDLAGLDQKIAILKAKAAVIRQSYSKHEVTGMIACLENRKKYDALFELGGRKITFREFFSRYDATDQEKIDALLKKHGLVMKEADIFIPNFPDDAVQAMTDYTAAIEALTKQKPRFFVIATADLFREKYADRDPILLAQSPFGFYYMILGAWDAEMMLLTEL